MLAFQSNDKMFWRGCSLVTSLNFSFQHVNRTFKFNLSTTSVRRKRSQNPRNKRCGHHTLLDKFLKHTSMDGSLIVKAPLNLKCSASYFDSENRIDTVKNYNVGLSRDEANRIERLNRRKGVYEEDEDSRSIADLAPDNNGAGVFMQMEDLHMKNISDEERNILHNIVSGSNSKVSERDEMGIDRPKSPIHVSLFGRHRHRVDSYSIMTDHVTHTHVYVSDASNSEEAVSMFSMDGGPSGTSITPPSGQVDIWRPKDISQVEITSGVWDDSDPEEIASTFKVYCPSHLLQQERNGISLVFHTPTLMNKIFMEAEREGCIDLNGLLLDQMITVGLVTEAGNIKVRDIWSEEIKLASNMGDVLCYGTIEGNIRAETLGDGDFIARSVVGPRLDVVTDRGDICVWDDCHVDTCQLFTTAGNIYCNRLYADAKICIKQAGVATLNIVSGSVACVVKNGDIIAHIDQLTQDSFMEVESGNVIINIPTKCSFRSVE